MKNLSILLNVLALKAILRLAPSSPLLNTNLRHNTLLTMPCRCVKCSEQFLPIAAHGLNLLYQSMESAIVEHPYPNIE